MSDSSVQYQSKRGNNSCENRGRAYKQKNYIKDKKNIKNNNDNKNKIRIKIKLIEENIVEDLNCSKNNINKSQVISK